MNMPIRRRFVEYDYTKKMILHNSEHLKEQDVDNKLLEKKTTWDDLTIVFYPFCGGWKTKVICNSTDQEIDINNISPIATDWFKRQLRSLVLNQLKGTLSA